MHIYLLLTDFEDHKGSFSTLVYGLSVKHEDKLSYSKMFIMSLRNHHILLVSTHPPYTINLVQV